MLVGALQRLQHEFHRILRIFDRFDCEFVRCITKVDSVYLKIRFFLHILEGNNFQSEIKWTLQIIKSMEGRYALFGEKWQSINTHANDSISHGHLSRLASSAVGKNAFDEDPSDRGPGAGQTTLLGDLHPTAHDRNAERLVRLAVQNHCPRLAPVLRAVDFRLQLINFMFRYMKKSF